MWTWGIFHTIVSYISSFLKEFAFNLYGVTIGKFAKLRFLLYLYCYFICLFCCQHNLLNYEMHHYLKLLVFANVMCRSLWTRSFILWKRADTFFLINIYVPLKLSKSFMYVFQMKFLANGCKGLITTFRWSIYFPVKFVPFNQESFVAFLFSKLMR